MSIYYRYARGFIYATDVTELVPTVLDIDEAVLPFISLPSLVADVPPDVSLEELEVLLLQPANDTANIAANNRAMNFFMLAPLSYHFQYFFHI